MKALIQRVSLASVKIEDKETRSIGRGLLVFLGIAPTDTEAEAVRLADKISALRLFPTRWAFKKTSAAPKTVLGEVFSEEKAGAEFDLSLLDIGGDILIISQFTLFADLRKGRRPDFTRAAKPDFAAGLYRSFVEAVEKRLILPGVDPVPVVAAGIFGASMRVTSVNEGPVTISIDTSEPTDQ